MRRYRQKCCLLCVRQLFSAVVIVSLVIFLSGIKVWSEVPISGEALPGLEGFDKVMVKLINKYDFPGASLAVAFNGKLVLARGYGYSKKSLVKKIPVEPRDRFRFASLTKPITATGIMLLVEEGKLSLDDHVIQLLQELGPQNEVTYYNPTPISRVKQVSPYGDFDLEAMDAYGGLIGTATDYIRFLTSIDGQRKPALLRPDTFKEMLAVPNDPTLKDKAVYYAKGFRVRKLAGSGVNFWHYGSLPAGTLAIAVRIWSGNSWVAFFNTCPDDHEKVQLDIDHALFEGIRPIKEIPSGDLFDKY